MIYHVQLSYAFDQDIYQEGSSYYLSYGSNKHCIGHVGMPMAELRLNMNTFLGA